MKIYKIIADKKPDECADCPLYAASSKKSGCGKFAKIYYDCLGSGRISEELVPDERCKIEVREEDIKCLIV